MSDDPHAPTSAAPDPEEATETVQAAEGAALEAAAEPEVAPEPEAAEPVAEEPPAAEPVVTPVVAPSESSWRTPPGTAAPEPERSSGRPEIAVGAAFAGGVAAALLLRLAGR